MDSLNNKMEAEGRPGLLAVKKPLYIVVLLCAMLLMVLVWVLNESRPLNTPLAPVIVFEALLSDSRADTTLTSKMKKELMYRLSYNSLVRIDSNQAPDYLLQFDVLRRGYDKSVVLDLNILNEGEASIWRKTYDIKDVTDEEIIRGVANRIALDVFDVSGVIPENYAIRKNGKNSKEYELYRCWMAAEYLVKDHVQGTTPSSEVLDCLDPKKTAVNADRSVIYLYLVGMYVDQHRGLADYGVDKPFDAAEAALQKVEEYTPFHRTYLGESLVFEWARKPRPNKDAMRKILNSIERLHPEDQHLNSMAAQTYAGDFGEWDRAVPIAKSLLLGVGDETESISNHIFLMDAVAHNNYEKAKKIIQPMLPASTMLSGMFMTAVGCQLNDMVLFNQGLKVLNEHAINSKSDYLQFVYDRNYVEQLQNGLLEAVGPPNCQFSNNQ